MEAKPSGSENTAGSCRGAWDGPSLPTPPEEPPGISLVSSSWPPEPGRHISVVLRPSLRGNLFYQP